MSNLVEIDEEEAVITDEEGIEGKENVNTVKANTSSTSPATGANMFGALMSTMLFATGAAFVIICKKNEDVK